MTNTVKFEVLVKQYLPAFLEISAPALTEGVIGLQLTPHPSEKF